MPMDFGDLGAALGALARRALHERWGFLVLWVVEDGDLDC